MMITGKESVPDAGHCHASRHHDTTAVDAGSGAVSGQASITEYNRLGPSTALGGEHRLHSPLNGIKRRVQAEGLMKGYQLLRLDDPSDCSINMASVLWQSPRAMYRLSQSLVWRVMIRIVYYTLLNERYLRE